MASKNNNRQMVPEARQALDDMTARENGAIGGSMTKKLIEQAQRQLSNK